MRGIIFKGLPVEGIKREKKKGPTVCVRVSRAKETLGDARGFELVKIVAANNLGGSASPCYHLLILVLPGLCLFDLLRG